MACFQNINCTVKTRIDNSRFALNCLISFKFSFYQNMFHFDTRSDLHLATAQLSVNALFQAILCIISNLITLLS